MPLIVKSQSRSTLLLLLAISILTGCTASQTSYLRERGELAHYVGSELEIEYPDLAHQPITEVAQTRAPITLSKPDFDKPWELSLQEVVQTALKNSKVIRNLGSVTPFGFAHGLSGRTAAAETVYDPAIFETDPQSGVQAALSAFDAQFTTSMFWQKTDRPQNVNTSNFGFSPFDFQQDLGTIDVALT